MCAQKGGGAQLYLPRTAGSVEEKDIRASRLAIVKVCDPVRIAESVEGKPPPFVVGAIDYAEILGPNKVFGEDIKLSNQGIWRFEGMRNA